MQPDKVIKKSISLPSDLLEAAIERAERYFAGNFSAYVQDLLSKDLKFKDLLSNSDDDSARTEGVKSDKPAIDPLSETILIDLAKPLCGEIVSKRLEENVMDHTDLTQQNVLKLLLDALDRFSSSEGFFVPNEAWSGLPVLVNETYLPLTSILYDATQFAEGCLAGADYDLEHAKTDHDRELKQTRREKWSKQAALLRGALEGMIEAKTEFDKNRTEKPASGWRFRTVKVPKANSEKSPDQSETA